MYLIPFILFSFLLLYVHPYNRKAAVHYASTFWNSANHDCNTDYLSCTPYSYFGKEHCNYGKDNGGDCANFVSQCLLAGGHPPLKKGECRGYPCWMEEPGALKLSNCLKDSFGWESSCEKLMAPPENIKPGDVLVYHASGCGSGKSHAVIVVKGGKDAKIACHSEEKYGVSYTFMTSKKYYHWLHYPD